MTLIPVFSFGDFQLDPMNACLWRGSKRRPLMPKDFAVLHSLVMHAGRLVTKEELFDVVWNETRVSPGVLKNSIERIRRVLGDRATTPRFIETVHGLGYRFIVEVVGREEANQKAKGKNQKAKVEDLPPIPNTQHPAPALVGREAELAQLHGWLDKARGGQRQIVFVTGEPGIGKTSLLEAFVAGTQNQEESQKAKVKGQKSKIPALSPAPSTQPLAPVFIGQGQCVEQYGAGEAYMPVLEALGRLGRRPDGARLITVLGQYAPTWLMQMPALLSTAELQALQPRVLGATRERMLREIAEALAVLTRERTLILVLEDLHWADASTLELLALLARQREPARVLVLGTYRPMAVLGNGHPLNGVTQELRAHHLCSELSLPLLSEDDVAVYVRQRFSSSVVPARFAEVLYRRTGGNPLFMVSVVDDLVAQGGIAADEGQPVLKVEIEEMEQRMPGNVQQMIERQLERLSPEERQVLEVASVAGMEFTTAAIAAITETTVTQVEQPCEALVRRHLFLSPRETPLGPERRVSPRYHFRHVLYPQVLSERIPPVRRRQLHQQTGEWKEAAYGGRAGEMAAELAMHFEQGQDYARAVRYRQRAAENALRRSANVEAITHLTRGLELLTAFPDTPERTQQELTLQITLAMPQTALKGVSASEVGSAYARARELCQQMGGTLRIFPVLAGLCAFYTIRGELETARELADQFLRLAEHTQDPTFLMHAHALLGDTSLFQGQLTLTRIHVEQGIALYNSQQYESRSFLFPGVDPGVFSLLRAAQVLWLLGYPAQALQRNHEAMTLAKEFSHPLLLAWVVDYAALIHRLRGEVQLTHARAEEAIAIAHEHGFTHVLADVTLLRGWVLVEQGRGEEGIPQICHSLASSRTLGAEVARTYSLALLAEAYGKVGQPTEGLTMLDEALRLVDKNGERFWEAELYRLRGELLLAQEGKGARQKSKGKAQKAKITDPRPLTPVPQAEADFLKAMDIARQQQAKSLELRAVTSLARLWRQHGKQHEACKRLGEVYNWFTEGFDTKDLREAKALLSELSQ